MHYSDSVYKYFHFSPAYLYVHNQNHTNSVMGPLKRVDACACFSRFQTSVDNEVALAKRRRFHGYLRPVISNCINFCGLPV